MRELQNDDMYILSEIADKMNLSFPKSPNMKDLSEEEKEQIRNDYGKEVITIIIRSIHKAKSEINRLLANVLEKSIEEIEKMSIKETIATLKELLKQDGVLDFFK